MSSIIELTVCVVILLGMRILFAAAAMSILISVIITSRKRIPVVMRSRLWFAVFAGLFIPYERSFSMLFARSNFEFILSRPELMNPGNRVAMTVFAISHLLPLLWFAGFMFFAVKLFADAAKTRRMLREGKILVCAAYFYNRRCHVYLPPDFEAAYTDEEKEMLLAHENRHIAQRDPLWYRFLPVIQCVFWFCPPIHKAARLFQQDRELLCDMRVTENRSKRDYSLLLLKEASKRSVGRSVPGIVSEGGNLTERIERILTPVNAGKKANVALLLCIIALFGFGLPGFRSIVSDDTSSLPFPNIKVFDVSDMKPPGSIFLTHIEGMERFVLPGEDGVSIDQDGMYDYALSLGFTPEQRLGVMYVAEVRPIVWEYFNLDYDREFAIEDLKKETIFLSFDDPEREVARFLFELI